MNVCTQSEFLIARWAELVDTYFVEAAAQLWCEHLFPRLNRYAWRTGHPCLLGTYYSAEYRHALLRDWSSWAIAAPARTT
jgi:hypothetical protein